MRRCKCGKSIDGNYPFCRGCQLKIDKEKMIKHGKVPCKKCGAMISKDKPGHLCPLCRFKSKK